MALAWGTSAGWVTVTSLSEPADRVGVVAVSRKKSTTTTFSAGTLPIVSDTPGKKPEPATVTGVPAEASPDPGEMLETKRGMGPSVTLRQAENSETEVVPVTTEPSSSERGSTTKKLALPWASVWTVVEPIGVAPSP